MEQKEKPCFGTGIAKGYGCGIFTKHRVYGLGKMCGCYSNWLFNSENGKIKLQKLNFSSKPKSVNKQQFGKKDNMSADKYRAQFLQPIINEIARFIDYGQPCIATGNFGIMNGGHYFSVGSNRTTALNLHNIHIQSFESNQDKGGDSTKYRLGLIESYGEKYFEFVECLKRHKPLHLTKSDMIDISLKAASIRNNLKTNLEQKTQFERIDFRNKINLQLGIYDKEFCEFVPF